MTRQKRRIRIVFGLLVFIFAFSVLSAAAGIWINGRLYEIEQKHEADRSYSPVQWSMPLFGSLSPENRFRQPVGEE